MLVIRYAAATVTFLQNCKYAVNAFKKKSLHRCDSKFKTENDNDFTLVLVHTQIKKKCTLRCPLGFSPLAHFGGESEYIIRCTHISTDS